MAIFGTSKKSEKKTTEKRVVRARQAKLAGGKEHDVIRAPWLSEKALIGTEKGVYVFEVPKEATRAEVAGAVQAIYKVAPKKVHLVHLPAKRKNLRTRRGFGTRAARHKAYVYLSAGDTIQFA